MKTKNWTNIKEADSNKIKYTHKIAKNIKSMLCELSLRIASFHDNDLYLVYEKNTKNHCFYKDIHIHSYDTESNDYTKYVMISVHRGIYKY